MICPAYQSAFIHDKDELRKKFSYFQQDSTPKILTASKNRYLVAEPMSYRARLRQMQTVAMAPVPVVVPDSIANPEVVSEEELRRAAQSVIDSLYVPDVNRDSAATPPPVDSTYVISKDREVRVLKYNMPDSLIYDEAAGKYVPQAPKYYVDEVGFNMEQDSYMWYLRKDIVLPDVRLAQRQQAGRDRAEQQERKGLKGFFKNLFKKKQKQESDTTDIVRPPEDEFDFIDPDSVTQTSEGPLLQEEERKGILGRRKNRKKEVQEQPTTPQPTPPAKKEEDDDDGF